MFTLVDFETTDLMKPCGCTLDHQPHVIEAAAIQVNKKFKIVKEFVSLVKPPEGIYIPHYATKIHGINDLDVRSAPPFKKIIKKFSKVFEGSQLFVAHNATFDLDILKLHLKRYGKGKKFPIPPQIFCTVEQSMDVMGFRMDLKRLYTHTTGKSEIENHHRALDDCHALLEIFKILYKGEK